MADPQELREGMVERQIFRRGIETTSVLTAFREVPREEFVPESLRELDTEQFLTRLEELDAPLAARHADAQSRGNVLRYLARLNQRGRARVGLVEVPSSHPAARLNGTDNQFAITTIRYNTTPLVIQGPGAGPEVTAQALLGDVLALG